MASYTMLLRRLDFLLLLALSWTTLASGLALDICSSINTADTNRNASIYQTNGLCHDFCMGTYAFAITQDNDCWCSNYAPAKPVQVDASECSQPCPAFPEEHCGGPGVWSYIILDGKAPLGSKGGSQPAPTTTAPPPPPPEETEETSTTASDHTITKPAPTPIIQTVTAGGSIATVTVMPTETGNSSHDSSGMVMKSSGLTTGEVVGIVVGIIVAILLAAAIALLLWFRRKRRNQESDYHDDPSIRGSSSGILGSRGPEMSLSGGPPGSPNSAGNRSSVLAIDPRMDPFKQGLYVRSASHESVNTLRDDHDYSRRIQPKVLRATNPDPEHQPE